MNETINTVRVITDHAIDPADEKLTITVLDAPGSGGASHLYLIEGFDSVNNPRIFATNGRDSSRNRPSTRPSCSRTARYPKSA